MKLDVDAVKVQVCLWKKNFKMFSREEGKCNIFKKYEEKVLLKLNSEPL